MTVGVYGFVAAIVKLDDVGLWLMGKGAAAAALGRGMVAFAPWMMKALTVVGTAAMFLVGGGILTHGIPALHHWIEATAASISASMGGAFWGGASSVAADGLVGVFAGAVVLGAVTLLGRLRRKA